MADDGVELLRGYLEAIVRRASHHLLPFPEVIGHVLVEVILRHDRGSLNCRVPPAGSELPVELSFTIGGDAYALAYTHVGGGRLELRTVDGAVVCGFRSGETWAWVNAAFNKL